MSVSVEDIKKLRQQTGAGIADVRQALEEANGDFIQAETIIKQKGLDRAESKSDREVKAGVVEVYSHGGRVGVLVEILCETDFVAKTEDFKTLSHDIALQIASMNPVNTTELLAQEFIKDPSLTIDSLIKSVIGKLGENIQIGQFSRIELGK